MCFFYVVQNEDFALVSLHLYKETPHTRKRNQKLGDDQNKCGIFSSTNIDYLMTIVQLKRSDFLGRDD